MTGCYIKGPQDTEFAASKDKQEICQCVCLGECAPSSPVMVVSADKKQQQPVCR